MVLLIPLSGIPPDIICTWDNSILHTDCLIVVNVLSKIKPYFYQFISCFGANFCSFLLWNTGKGFPLNINEYYVGMFGHRERGGGCICWWWHRLLTRNFHCAYVLQVSWIEVVSPIHHTYMYVRTCACNFGFRTQKKWLTINREMRNIETFYFINLFQ